MRRGGRAMAEIAPRATRAAHVAYPRRGQGHPAWRGRCEFLLSVGRTRRMRCPGRLRTAGAAWLLVALLLACAPREAAPSRLGDGADGASPEARRGTTLTIGV